MSEVNNYQSDLHLYNNDGANKVALKESVKETLQGIHSNMANRLLADIENKVEVQPKSAEAKQASKNWTLKILGSLLLVAGIAAGVAVAVATCGFAAVVGTTVASVCAGGVALVGGTLNAGLIAGGVGTAGIAMLALSSKLGKGKKPQQLPAHHQQVKNKHIQNKHIQNKQIDIKKIDINKISIKQIQPEVRRNQLDGEELAELERVRNENDQERDANAKQLTLGNKEKSREISRAFTAEFKYNPNIIPQHNSNFKDMIEELFEKRHGKLVVREELDLEFITTYTKSALESNNKSSDFNKENLSLLRVYNHYCAYQAVGTNNMANYLDCLKALNDPQMKQQLLDHLDSMAAELDQSSEDYKLLTLFKASLSDAKVDDLVAK
ncbi:MAG: hypothetical protein K6F05_07795 [Succinivibrio sp.]|nr:hypothetical protein [Succinivibrio sp.]